MMSTKKRISVDMLVHVNRDFGFHVDFMLSFVPMYVNLFRVVGTPGGDLLCLELVCYEKDLLSKSLLDGLKFIANSNSNM